MPLYELDGVRPQLPADGTYWIAPSAELIGNVVVEEEACIWFNAVLRGDNEVIRIGRRSNVQDGCVFHTDPGFPLTIGERCTIGHQAMLHGCTIGDGSLIGMSATVLNGARIGEGSLVGAGAVVTEGKEFPPKSLIVGAPARAIRPVEGKVAEIIVRSADVYFKRWQRYAKGLKRID